MIDLTITAATRLRRSPRVIQASLGAQGGAVILHLDTARYHQVNRVGAIIWSLLEEETTFADLVDGVNRRVTDAPDGLEDEVAGFVAALLQQHLVTASPPPSPP